MTNIDNIDKNIINIDIVMVCRDNEDYFNSFFPEIVKQLREFNPYFYIYENNSKDKTKLILNNYKKYNNFFIQKEDLKISDNRYINICNARNRLLNFYKNNIKRKPHYILQLDTNLLFSSKTITSLINIFNKKVDPVMVCPYSCFYNPDLHNATCYFDFLALNYGKNFKNTNFQLFTKENYFKGKDYTNEKTVFGGMGLLRQDIYLKIAWKLKKNENVKNIHLINGKTICEHWNYCEELRKYGNLYLIKNPNVVWYMDKYIDNKSKKHKFINYLIREKIL